MILDTKGIGITGFAGIKYDDIKDFIEEMGSILRGWLKKLFLVNVSIIARMIYQVAKIKLEQFMKMRISVSGDCSDLKTLIDKENLEEKYGG